ncbi:MAG: hypothetical protein O3A15_09365 [Proteobacteria bacterium]|nr:hypothetical protein [Pseudomonadota bacterium]
MSFKLSPKDNVSYILFSLQQTKDALKFGFTLNESRRNLETALHQYWQNKEMGLHSTAQKSRIPKSDAAKVGRGACDVEHVVPRKVIIDELLKIDHPNQLRIRDYLEKYYRVCVVTKEEHQRLTQMKLRSEMPKDWDRLNPFSRYDQAGISVDEFEAELIEIYMDKFKHVDLVDSSVNLASEGNLSAFSTKELTEQLDSSMCAEDSILSILRVLKDRLVKFRKS